MRKVDPARYEEKRGEILEAAVRCFARSGFHGSSIAGLCAEAGMSPGHLYHYFASKEAIVEAMVVANLERTADAFAASVDDGASVLDVIAAQFDHDGTADGSRAPLLFDMLAEAGRSPPIAEILHTHSRGMETLLSDLLRRGQQDGTVDAALDPVTVAPLLISMLDGAKSLPLRSPDVMTDRTRDMLRRLIARFLGPAA